LGGLQEAGSPPHPRTYVLCVGLPAPPKGQSAIQAARKDLGDYVSQAQKGINQQLVSLSESVPPSTPTTDADAQLPTPSSSRDLADSVTTDGGSSGSSSTSVSTAMLPDLQQQEDAQSPTPQTLFTRLQSSIPPDLLTSLRDTIPDSVRDSQARMDLAHAAQARMQGAAARGEELLRGASVFLRDAVRVVPPDPHAAASTASASSRPHSRSASASATAAAVGETKSSPAVQAIGLTPATRRGALLRALRTNPAILRVDPAAEERSAVFFAAWVDAGRDAASDASRRESELAADDGTLGSTLSALGACSFFWGIVCCIDADVDIWDQVPGELSEDVFWTRYFFRVHQINQEDEQRKAVLSGKAPPNLSYVVTVPNANRSKS